MTPSKRLVERSTSCDTAWHDEGLPHQWWGCQCPLKRLRSRFISPATFSAFRTPSSPAGFAEVAGRSIATSKGTLRTWLR